MRNLGSVMGDVLAIVGGGKIRNTKHVIINATFCFKLWDGIYGVDCDYH